jgi:hypothetical protein
MRGLAKTFATLALAGGLAMVPAIGSQGAGALGEQHAHADSQLLSSTESRDALHAADQLAERRAVGLTRT